MFFLFILAAWVVMHVYVFWRISSLPAVEKHVPRVALSLVAFFLATSFLFARSLTAIPWLGHSLEVLGANWIGVLFLTFACLLAADLVTLFGFVFSHAAIRIRTWALVTAVILSGIALLQGLRPPAVETYEVPIRNLPEDLNGSVIVMMSDLHLGSLLGETWLSERVKQVQAMHPDMVVLCGDVIEGDDPSERSLLSHLGQLRAPMGIWAVAGNHESHGHPGALNNSLESAGIHVLRNRWAELRPGFVIAGVDDLTHVRRSGGSADDLIAKALGGRPPAAITVFVSHSPLHPEQASTAGVSLMLSGHTHNGQIWPFTYFVQQIYPRMAGLYKVGDMSLVVCRGTGTWGPRMRLWRRGEISKITLVSASRQGDSHALSPGAPTVPVGTPYPN